MHKWTISFTDPVGVVVCKKCGTRKLLTELSEEEIRQDLGEAFIGMKQAMKDVFEGKNDEN